MPTARGISGPSIRSWSAQARLLPWVPIRKYLPMKVAELLEVKDYTKGVWTGGKLKLRNRYSQKDLDSALRSKPTAQTVVVRNTATGEIVGKRTIYQA